MHHVRWQGHMNQLLLENYLKARWSPDSLNNLINMKGTTLARLEVDKVSKKPGENGKDSAPAMGGYAPFLLEANRVSKGTDSSRHRHSDDAT